MHYHNLVKLIHIAFGSSDILICSICFILTF